MRVTSQPALLCALLLLGSAAAAAGASQRLRQALAHVTAESRLPGYEQDLREFVALLSISHRCGCLLALVSVSCQSARHLSSGRPRLDWSLTPA